MTLFFLALGMAATAAAQPVVQYAEPVSLSLKAGTASFDAYGRRFSLSLADNERALRKLPAQERQQVARYRLLRGSLEGTPGSWVRLTESARGIEGAIWDGRELYAVTRYEQIAPFLTTPLEAAPGQTVVYRLSDMREALPQDFCALGGDVAEAQVTALDQYVATVSEIQAGTVTPTLSRQVEIALIADSDFQHAESPDPLAAMMARYNIVEGIFAEQVGLLLEATEVRLVPASADPFTSDKGSTLLDQVGAYREITAAVRTRGLAHLMTGKDLEGTMAGLAYVGAVCEIKRGVSLSQRHYGTTISALIMAHELGHNFGAIHDGTPGTACADVSRHIMSPSVSGYTTFSRCSLDAMAAVLSKASCVTPVEYADVALEPQVDGIGGEAGRSFTLPFVVRSTGNQWAENVDLTITVPGSAAVTLESAGSTLGTCSISGPTAVCHLGDLAEGASAAIEVVARSDHAGSFNVQAEVKAANDRLASNNRRVVPVSLRSGIDAAVSVSAAMSEVPVGAPLELRVDAVSRRSLAVRNATVTLKLNQPVVSASMSGATCAINGGAVNCTVAEIPAGSTRRLTVQAHAQSAGPLLALAEVNVQGDGDLHNNKASVDGWVQAERDVELWTPGESNQLNVGESHEIPFTLRSRGSSPTGDVALIVSLSSAALQVESIDAGGSPCQFPEPGLLRCELGALAPGITRTVRLRVRGTDAVAADVMASALTAGDGYAANNNVSVLLHFDHAVDLAIAQASGGAALEDTPFEGQVTLRSQGRQAATGAMLDITLRDAGEWRSVRIHNGKECELVSATLARCALPDIARWESVHVDYSAMFAEPGEHAIQFASSTPHDTGSYNDELTKVVLVRPWLDVGVSGSLRMVDLFTGQRRQQTFTVSVDRRDLGEAGFLATHGSPALRVEAIDAEAGECRVDDVGGHCDFASLAAGSKTSVTVTWLAADEPGVAHPVVSVTTPGDVVTGNNALSAHVESFAATDVELRVDTSVAGASGAVLTFPLIELVNGDQPALAPKVEVTLPSGVTVVDVSAGNALCSGTSTLRCDFPSLAAGETGSVSLSVRASRPGEFTTQVRVSVANDHNPANDTRSVKLDIGGSQPAPPLATTESKGGGGRLEWLALLVLALLKWGQSPFSNKWGLSPFPSKRGRASA